MNENSEKKRVYSSRVIDPYLKLFKRFYPNLDVDYLLAYSGMTFWEVADQSHWFTHEQVSRFIHKAIELTGNAHLAREAGQFGVSPETFGVIRTYALSFINPHVMFDKVEHLAKQLVLSSVYTSRRLSDTSVEITVTPNPGSREELFQCENRLGVFEAGVRNFPQYRLLSIEHPECMFDGGKICRYIVKWKPTRAIHFTRLRNLSVATVPLLSIPALLVEPIALFATLSFSACLFFFLDRLMVSARMAEIAAGMSHLEQTRDQLLEQLDINYNNARLTSELGQAISVQTTIHNVVESAMRILHERLDFDRGMILLANNDRTRLTYRAGFGHNAEHLALLKQSSFRLDNPESKGVFVKSFHDQMPFIVDNFEEFERRHTPNSVRLARAIGVKSFICCPIVCESVSIGILAVDNLKSSRPLMERDKSLLMGIAPMIGVSIRNAELLLAKEKEFHSTLQVLAASIDARDPLTAGHSEKVTEYAVGICDQMSLDTSFRECIRVASLLHDYGKIGVPDAILKKPGRLSAEEYNIVKTHSAQTESILARINFEGCFRDVPLIAGSHHERWDGTGYPRGLRGEEIHLGARIIAVADHFEAITSKRHYRDPMPVDVALSELVSCSGSYFDPRVVEAFLAYYMVYYNGNQGGGGGNGKIRPKRHPMRTPAVVWAEGKKLNGNVEDICFNGAYVALGPELSQDMRIRIEVIIPGCERPLVADGRIAWINSGDNRPKQDFEKGCGVQFTSLEAESEKDLQDYLARSIEAPAGVLH
jgi:HD-GYP domain-containing protein (c-di-GMP phosphodiesterase class II)